MAPGVSRSVGLDQKTARAGTRRHFLQRAARSAARKSARHVRASGSDAPRPWPKADPARPPRNQAPRLVGEERRLIRVCRPGPFSRHAPSSPLQYSRLWIGPYELRSMRKREDQAPGFGGARRDVPPFASCNATVPTTASVAGWWYFGRLESPRTGTRLHVGTGATGWRMSGRRGSRL